MKSAPFGRGALSEYLRGALWFLPSVLVAGSLVAGTVLSQVSVDERSLLGRLAFQGDAGAARELLIVVSATMITVTGLVFTLTLVALQIASTQFSPRLLRNFLRDRKNQLVLGTFVSTFAYSLAGLHTVGQPVAGEEEFVPRLAISGSLVLAFASVAMLVYFIHHIAHSIRIDTIMKEVERETLAVMDESEPEPLDGVDSPQPLPDPPARAVVILAARSGYVDSMQPEMLVEIAAKYDVVIRIQPMVGDHVVEGTALGWVWPRYDAGDQPDPQRFRDSIDDAVVVGFERTTQQDVRFGLRQLVDIALRAISPAINDPYTASQAVHHLSVLLNKLVARRLTNRVFNDSGGTLRVAVPHPDFDHYLELACGQIRRFGAKEPAVLRALVRLLADVGAGATIAARRESVASQVRLVLADAQREIPQRSDLATVEELAALSSVERLTPTADV
ncbi:MAG: DUF2254 domain-containing protein [Actinomycetota bacterium]|nr:DUF2254 domain-containing protein [Actinomycetota bacterium]